MNRGENRLLAKIYQPLNICDYSKCEHKCCDGFSCGAEDYCTTKTYVVAVVMFVLCIALLSFTIYIIVRVIRSRRAQAAVNPAINVTIAARALTYVEHDPPASLTIDALIPNMQLNTSVKVEDSLQPPIKEAPGAKGISPGDSTASSHIGLHRPQELPSTIPLAVLQTPAVASSLRQSSIASEMDYAHPHKTDT